MQVFLAPKLSPLMSKYIRETTNHVYLEPDTETVLMQLVSAAAKDRLHFSALSSLTQPLLGCRLYLPLTQYPYDPGALPSSANQCILGKMYLRSNLSRTGFSSVVANLIEGL